MPALNFKKQFQHAILTGAKEQTIRATRKAPIKVGDMLHLFTGMRTASCLRLGVYLCRRVRPIRITIAKGGRIYGQWEVFLEDRYLSAPQIEALAKDDGFASASAMMEFFEFNHGLNFEGQLIEWRV